MTDFHTVQLSNAILTISSTDLVKKLTVLCSTGAITIIGNTLFQGISPSNITIENGQSIEISGNPINGITITSSTINDVAQITMSYV